MPFINVLGLVTMLLMLQIADCMEVLAYPGTDTPIRCLSTGHNKSPGVTGAGVRKGPGIVYSPYSANKQCKTAAVMTEEVSRLKGVSMIRIYGGDCNQISTILKATIGIGAKLMVGVWDIGQLDKEMKDIIKVVGNDWSNIDTLAIGNELVDQAPAAEKAAKIIAVVSAVNKAREMLAQAKWKGVPVVTVDTWISIRDHHKLCQVSDYIAANAHPYFDRNVEAGESGKFLAGTVMQVLSKIGGCEGKRIRITETGWPHSGNPNGKAKAGPTQQKTAVESMVKSIRGDQAIILSAYDEGWKNGGHLGIEKYWGISKIFNDVLKAAG